LTGITRMRVRQANQGGITAESACNTATVYGEYEDYLITIAPGTLCSDVTGGTIVADPTDIACPNTVITLSASGYTSNEVGLSYQWQESSNGVSFNNIGSATPVYADLEVGGLTSSMYYKLLVTCSYSSNSSQSNVVTVNVTPPSVVSTTPGARCGEGSVTLSAVTSPGTQAKWFASET